MRPYYEASGVTIYHGDCLEVVPSIDLCDLAVCDPPFFMPAQHYAARSEWSRTWGDTAVLSGWWARVVEVVKTRLRQSGGVFTFCDDESYSVFYPVLYSRFPALSSLVWNKGRIGMGTPWRHAHEFILHARCSEAKWCGSGGESDVLLYSPIPSAQRLHPVDKPSGLLAKLISVTTESGDLVVDPFMGGGSTIVAAQALGRRAIGIEIEERYCEIAAERLAQEVLPLGGVA